MMNVLTAASIVLAILLIGLAFGWRWKVSSANSLKSEDSLEEVPSANAVHVIHRMCPHHNSVQPYEVEQKDSLDDHLEALTKKLADKEGRLLLSKCKIRETQNEIENLHAIDHDVRLRYREIVESLRKDLQNNEKECKKLQEQIEWVSHRRAELKDEVHRGQMLYGEVAAELANNLAELSKTRKTDVKPFYTPIVVEKPKHHSSSARCRKEPHLPTPDLVDKKCHQFSNERILME